MYRESILKLFELNSGFLTFYPDSDRVIRIRVIQNRVRVIQVQGPESGNCAHTPNHTSLPHCNFYAQYLRYLVHLKTRHRNHVPTSGTTMNLASNEYRVLHELYKEAQTPHNCALHLRHYYSKRSSSRSHCLPFKYLKRSHVYYNEWPIGDKKRVHVKGLPFDEQSYI